MLVALSCVDETNVVGNATPFSLTTAPLMKLLPYKENVEFPNGTLLGDHQLNTGVGLRTVSAALAKTVGSATLVALIVTGLDAGSAAGAVYFPLASIKPTAALPPVIPLTDHVTAVVAAPLTMALNCCVLLTEIVVLTGSIVTTTAGVNAAAIGAAKTHAMIASSRSKCR